MPLILAIEPDSRQASRLTALAKSPLRAEILVGESTATAFAALGTRTPDLILTSLLLSPKDGNELADRLRELDAAGIQVQTLVVPVLGTAARRSRQASRGLLTRLRRSKITSEVTDGCDPAMFAAQITEYLDGAAADRQAAAVELEDRLPIQQDPVYATRQEAQMAGSSSAGEAAARGAAAREEAAREEAAREEAAREEAAREAAARETAAREAVAREAVAREGAAREEAVREQAAREQVAREEAARERAAREQTAREETARAAVAREAAAREHAARDKAAREEAARERAAREQTAREEAAQAAAARDAAAREYAAREKAAREEAARERAAREQAAREEAARAAAALEAAARAAAAAREYAAQEVASRSRPLDDDLAAFVTGIEDPAAGEPPVASPAPVGAVTQPEWKQLLTAIKRDIEHLRTAHPKSGAGPAAQRSSNPSAKTPRSRPTGARTRVKVPARVKAPQPLQDEWGFFDPEQCGFAALLAKLDAVTDSEDSPAKKPARPRH